VLETMGVTQEVGLGVIRFSLGRGTTREEIDAVAERLSASPELHSWQCFVSFQRIQTITFEALERASSLATGRQC
jgi:hypothetical protein